MRVVQSDAMGIFIQSTAGVASNSGTLSFRSELPLRATHSPEQEFGPDSGDKLWPFGLTMGESHFSSLRSVASITSTGRRARLASADACDTILLIMSRSPQVARPMKMTAITMTRSFLVRSEY